MLKDWDRQQPGRIEHIFNSMQNIKLSQMADTSLFDFQNLQLDRSTERKEYEFADDQTVDGKPARDAVKMVNIVNL